MVLSTYGIAQDRSSIHFPEFFVPVSGSAMDFPSRQVPSIEQGNPVAVLAGRLVDTGEREAKKGCEPTIEAAPEATPVGRDMSIRHIRQAS